MNLWGVTHTGVVRQQNQDAYFIDKPQEDVALAVVCDGMGGAKSGNVASALAVETVEQVLHNHTIRQWKADPGGLLSFAVEQANEAVHYRAGIDRDCRGMGTTLVAAMVLDGVAHIINIGDSRAYLVRGDGIKRITRDHSLVEDLVERGDLTPEQARQHPQKNFITRALGAEPRCRADLFCQPLSEGDYLLLCSDGLINVATDQELLYEAIHGGAPEDCCQRLLDTTLSRGAPDNVTIVFMQM